jgi:hypothetical protein
MFDLRTVNRALFGKPIYPYIPNLRITRDDTLFFESLTRGAWIGGNPGTGKTTWCAMETIRYALTYPDRPIFILDASGSLTNEIIEIAHYIPEGEKVLKRIALDIPGHEKWVVPKPMFHPDYGLTEEELVAKAVLIFKELKPRTLTETPMMAEAINTTAPRLCELLMTMTNEHGESWQITEAKRLLIDRYEGGELSKACKGYGERAPAAKWYFEKTLLRSDITPTGFEARTASLLGALSTLETKPLRARYGYCRPGITDKEVIEKGLIKIVSGEAITNQNDAQALVFWEEFAGIRALINKRIPHDPASEPCLLIIDEVYRLFEIEGMAKALGEVSTYFRSRKLMPVIIIQAFWQLTELLKEQIWNLGTVVAFAMENQKDAYAIAQQLAVYDPESVKFNYQRQGANPTAEPDRGQFLQIADFIQKKMGWRQMLLRRYINEREKDPYIRFVEQTRDKPKGTLPASLTEIKEELFRKRALPVKDVLTVVNQRKLSVSRTSAERPRAD